MLVAVDKLDESLMHSSTPHDGFDLSHAQLIATCYPAADTGAEYEAVKRCLYVDAAGRFFVYEIDYYADGRRVSQTHALSPQLARAWCEENNVDADTVKRYFSHPSSVAVDEELLCLLTRRWRRDDVPASA